MGGSCSCDVWSEADERATIKMREEARRMSAEDEALARETTLSLRDQSIKQSLILLPRMINLAILDLQRCGIDDEEAVRLADAMKNCKLLKIFDVQYNRIEARGFEALTDSTGKMTIEILDYQGKIDGIGNKMNANCVAKLLTLPPPLEPNSPEVIKGECVKIERLYYPKMGVICLVSVCLSEQNLGDEGASVVASHTAGLVNLRTLFFYDNGVGEKGAKAFAGMLPGIPKLEYLSLSRNPIPQSCRKNFEEANQIRRKKGMPDVEVRLSG